MRRALAIGCVASLAGCVHSTIRPLPPPVIVQEPVTPVSPAVEKTADRTLHAADQFVKTHPLATTSQIIKAMELSARLQADLKFAKRHRSSHTIDAVYRDIEELKQAIQPGQ